MKLKAFKLGKLNFWQQWLFISFLLWIILTLTQILANIYNTIALGKQPLNADGSPVTFGDRFVSYNFEQLIWLDIALFIFLAEVNYRFIFRKHNTFTFIISSLSFGFLGAVYTLIKAFMQMKEYTGFLLAFSVPFIAILSLLFFFYAIFRDYLYHRIHTAETHLEQSQAELNALKAQVNPHFFFNTLNSIYGTALEEKAPRTADSIEQLAGIMRYTMNEAQENYTAMTNEVRFIEEYLHLQRLRLPERQNIDLQTTITYDGKPCEIAPMLLIPFIENAFKYGVSIDHPCFIHIQLTVAVQKLQLIVENSISSSKALHRSHGIGIDNTRKRLQLLYPNQHQLNITHDGLTFKVQLDLDLSVQQNNQAITKTHTFEKVS